MLNKVSGDYPPLELRQLHCIKIETFNTQYLKAINLAWKNKSAITIEKPKPPKYYCSKVEVKNSIDTFRWISNDVSYICVCVCVGRCKSKMNPKI